MDEDENLMVSPLRLPLLSGPVVHTVGPAVAPGLESRHLGDHLGLLLQQGHAVGQEDDLLLQCQLITQVFDQHDSDEGLAAASPQVHDDVLHLGLLQELHL